MRELSPFTTNPPSPAHREWGPGGEGLAQSIAARFAALPGVVAITLGGSRSTGTAEPTSDLDLYVYAPAPLPLAARAAIVGDATTRELDHHFWEPGDVWIDPHSGLMIDIMYRSPAWIENELDRVLVRHEAALGYTTCLWDNVLAADILADPTGWFHRLQVSARQPYPEPLRRAIVAKNHPILRCSLTSYRQQIDAALRRRDALSVQHRLTALLASYVDILFALNRQPHPGEKRVAAHIEALCPARPPDLTPRLDALLAATPPPWPASDIFLPHLHALLDDLDSLLHTAGLLQLPPAEPEHP